jgi:lipopolysaccharide export system protein LptA
MKQPLFCIIAAAVAIPAARAQSQRLPVPRPAFSTSSDPLNGGALPSKGGSATPSAGAPRALTDSTQPGESEDKKAKGPTEITSGEATFDQKAHIAIFMKDVVVKDPEFNVVCDKLTALLKHDEPGKPGVKSKATPRPTPAKAGETPKKTGGGGLERAIAEMNPGGRVEITQDKKEADGTITHSIGHGTKADYNATTGDIVLTGRPDVKKGTDWVIATDDSTVITLNRDGHMSTKGPTKTVIISESVK